MARAENEGAGRFLQSVALLDLEVRPDESGPIEIGAVVAGNAVCGAVVSGITIDLPVDARVVVGDNDLRASCAAVRRASSR